MASPAVSPDNNRKFSDMLNQTFLLKLESVYSMCDIPHVGLEICGYIQSDNGDYSKECTWCVRCSMQCIKLCTQQPWHEHRCLTMRPQYSTVVMYLRSIYLVVSPNPHDVHDSPALLCAFTTYSFQNFSTHPLLVGDWYQHGEGDIQTYLKIFLFCDIWTLNTHLQIHTEMSNNVLNH